MRISDWSSDVCSSDLTAFIPVVDERIQRRRAAEVPAATAQPVSGTTAIPPACSGVNRLPPLGQRPHLALELARDALGGGGALAGLELGRGQRRAEPDQIGRAHV